MAAFSTKPMLLCVTFTAILSLCLVLSLAEFQRFLQPTKADGSISFLVVGDWGRRGGYNQSQVAQQVTIFSTLHIQYSFPTLCLS